MVKVKLSPTDSEHPSTNKILNVPLMRLKVVLKRLKYHINLEGLYLSYKPIKCIPLNLPLLAKIFLLK